MQNPHFSFLRLMGAVMCASVATRAMGVMQQLPRDESFTPVWIAMTLSGAFFPPVAGVWLLCPKGQRKTIVTTFSIIWLLIVIFYSAEYWPIGFSLPEGSLDGQIPE